MHDAFAVRRIERIGNLNRQWQQLFRFHRPAGDQVLQGHAVEELHDHEGSAIFLADVMDGADVGMIERRRRSRLTAEALQRLRDREPRFGEKLERDKTAQAGVLGLVHHTHAATAELLTMR